MRIVLSSLIVASSLTLPSLGEVQEGKSKGSAMTECLKDAGIGGYYRVTSAGVPATSVKGRTGDGMLGPGFFEESRATIKVSPDGQEEADFVLGSFLKGELVRVEIGELSSLENFKIVKMPPAILVRSAFKHNITRGEGAFRHESPEVVRLDITAKHFDVPCDVVKSRSTFARCAAASRCIGDKGGGSASTDFGPHLAAERKSASTWSRNARSSARSASVRRRLPVRTTSRPSRSLSSNPAARKSPTSCAAVRRSPRRRRRRA